MKLFIVTILVSLLAAVANAKADTSVYLGGWSKHVSSSHATNNNQRFVMLNYNNYLVGRYTNSYGDATALIGYEYHIESLSTEDLDVSISPALTHGYKVCPMSSYREIEDNAPSKYCPVISLGVKYTKYRVQPVLAITPKSATILINVKF